MRIFVICACVALGVASASAAVVLTMDRYACVGEPSSQTGQEVGLFGTISSTGTSSVSLQCRLSTDQPEAWLPPGVCIGVACFPSDMDFSLDLPPAASLVVHLSFYPYDVPGKGVYWLRFEGGGVADSVRLEVLSGVPSLVVADDEGAGAVHFIERALPSGRMFLTWDQTLEPLALSDVALLERVIWITGSAAEGCLSPDEAEVLTALLEDGGTLLLSGQNVLEGAAGAAFGQEELGAVVESASVTSRHVRGAAGTSFEVLSFDIAGGDGANNQTSPDGLSPVGLAIRALRYESGEGATVARVGLGGRRSLVCGFGLEACADSTVLQQTLDFFLRWLDGDVAVDEVPAPKTLTIRISPNPARGVITADLAVPDGTPVRMWLSDLGGRHVADLHDGAWFSRPMRVPRLASGTYVVKVRTDAAYASQPLVVVEESR